MPAKPRDILLVDGHSLIFRAFHALPLLSSGGVYTNAVQGFFSMLFKVIADYRPEALCVMLDTHAPTFRHTMYDAYKAGRKPTPEELKPQVPIIRDILGAMKITVCEMEGYEADDLLGTAARLANEQGIRAYILTGDRDSFQLITQDTNVILTKKGISESLLLSPEALEKQYGYAPSQAVDLKALMGDSSDNIPGIPGVGEKTALKLIAQYGDMDGVYAHAEEIPGKLGEKIRANKDKAELSRKLGTICVTAPIDVDFADCGIADMRAALPVLHRYKLRRLSELLEQLFTGEKSKPAPAPTQAEGQMEPVAAPPPMQPFMTVIDEQKLSLIAKSLVKAKDEITLYLGENAAAICAADGRVWVAPYAVDLLTVGMGEEQALRALEPVLAAVPLVVHDAKALFHKTADLKLPMPVIRHDVMIAAYLLEPEQKNSDLETVLYGAPIEPKRRKDAPAFTPEKAAGGRICDAVSVPRAAKPPESKRHGDAICRHGDAADAGAVLHGAGRLHGGYEGAARAWRAVPRRDHHAARRGYAPVRWYRIQPQQPPSSSPKCCLSGWGCRHRGAREKQARFPPRQMCWSSSTIPSLSRSCAIAS